MNSFMCECTHVCLTMNMCLHVPMHFPEPACVYMFVYRREEEREEWASLMEGSIKTLNVWYPLSLDYFSPNTEAGKLHPGCRPPHWTTVE